MDPIIDWQVSRHEIKARGTYLLETGKWADCHFLVGDSQMLPGHKLILAMASPVFEAMFYGSLAEKNDPIEILDVQPEAFKALLEYIYTDKININSVDKACELCYAAKKYMLPYVVEQCTKFLWSDLCPKNACRAYEFAKLFGEPKLMEKCLQIICTKTCDVIQDSSFEEVQLTTVITILDQDALNIDSELDLFVAINRYAEKHGLLNSPAMNEELPPITEPLPGPSNVAIPVVAVEQQQPAVAAQPAVVQPPRQQEPLNIKDAVKRIRFLTLNPRMFAEGPARTSLLTQTEAFAILMNISSANSGHPMPEGFSSNKTPRSYNIVVADSPSPQQYNPLDQVRNEILERILPPPPNIYLDEPLLPRMDRKMYCVRSSGGQTEILNTAVIDSSISFIVDRSICIVGIQVPTQIRPASSHSNHHVASQFLGDRNDGYSELLYACLQDSVTDSRLTYTHSTQRVSYNSVLEIQFDRPVYVQRNKLYKISVCFNRSGWYPYPTSRPVKNISVDGVYFSFESDPGTRERDGLIRSIVYTHNREV